MKVFISYSHKDEEWKNRLEKELKVFELEGNLEIWSDTDIKVGTDFASEIQKAIEQSSIAILLISTDFLSSDFIIKIEIPKILEKKERKECCVFPVILAECNWKVIKWLKDMQVYPPKGKPLMSFPEYERKCHLCEIAKRINSFTPIGLGHLNDIKQIFGDNIEIPSIVNLKNIYSSIFSNSDVPSEVPKSNGDNARLYLFLLLNRLALFGKNTNTKKHQFPIINFLIQLKKYIKDESINEKIFNWVSEINEFSQQDIKQISDSLPSIIKTETTLTHLLIKIEEKKEINKFGIKACLYKDIKNTIQLPILSDYKDEDIDLENNFFELKEIPYVIEELLYHIIEHHNIQPQFISIELFLPLDKINLEVDHWSSDNMDPIATNYQMVVRVKERYEKKYHMNFVTCWNSHFKKEESIKGRLLKDSVLWLDKPEIRGLKQELKGGKLFFALTFVPEKDFLDALIRLGTPFILWPRKIYKKEQIQNLQQITCCHFFEEVPEILLNERLKRYDQRIDENHILNHISLLWDNYDRQFTDQSDFGKNAISL